MEWDANKYQTACGRVTEHGMKLVDVLRNMPRGRVLDVGCGTGVLTNEIAGFADEVIGIDSSTAMVEKAKALYPALRFYVMDATGLRWENYFSAVFSNAVFHFIKRQDALLDGVLKALTPGGALVCEFGASGNIAGLLEAVERECASRGKTYTTRFYYPSADEYEKLLASHGFAVESICVYDLDTKLIEGEDGLRNWINQIFNVELGFFEISERKDVLAGVESALRGDLWDGSNWHLLNKRIRVIAKKGTHNTA